jgi:hypothetical protein
VTVAIRDFGMHVPCPSGPPDPSTRTSLVLAIVTRSARSTPDLGHAPSLMLGQQAVRELQSRPEHHRPIAVSRRYDAPPMPCACAGSTMYHAGEQCPGRRYR